MPSSDTPPPRRKRRSWRWHTPPALTLETRSLEGSAILEARADALGTVLWQAARDVYLWGRTDPDLRRDLFSSEAGTERSVALESIALEGAPRGALEALNRLVASPGRVREATIVGACHTLAGWADRTGQPQVALEFSRAAAIAAPTDARAALHLAHTARAQEQIPLAEAWFRRTVVLGRRAGDWESYARAFVGLGGLLRRRGDLAGARQHLVRASRACRRHGLGEIRASVLHDLHVVAAESGAFEEAVVRGRRALRAYGRGHTHTPALVLDICRMWIDHGAPGMARPVLAGLVRRLRPGPVRTAAVGMLGRASALVGDREAFDRCVADLGAPAAPRPATASNPWMDLAHGARVLGEEEVARRWEEALGGSTGQVGPEGATPAVAGDYVPSEEEARLQRDVMRAVRRMGE